MEFRPVAGWEGSYEVSAAGVVRSAATGRTLKHTVSGDGYHRANLKRNGRRESRTVHRLVMEAFEGPRPAGAHIRHLNGDKDDNRRENLRYGSPAENAEDTKRHGRNANLNKDACPRGHAYSGWNLISRQNGRSCRSCARAAAEVCRQAKRGRRVDPDALANAYYARLQLGRGERNKHYGGSDAA